MLWGRKSFTEPWVISLDHGTMFLNPSVVLFVPCHPQDQSFLNEKTLKKKCGSVQNVQNIFLSLPELFLRGWTNMETKHAHFCAKTI